MKRLNDIAHYRRELLIAFGSVSILFSLYLWAVPSGPSTATSSVQLDNGFRRPRSSQEDRSRFSEYGVKCEELLAKANALLQKADRTNEDIKIARGYLMDYRASALSLSAPYLETIERIKDSGVEEEMEDIGFDAFKVFQEFEETGHPASIQEILDGAVYLFEHSHYPEDRSAGKKFSFGNFVFVYREFRRGKVLENNVVQTHQHTIERLYKLRKF